MGDVETPIHYYRVFIRSNINIVQILISNDDGYLAPGIKVLAQALKEIADITVVAPDRNRSASSHSLTLTRPLRITTHQNGFYSVDGTPSDSVHLAITGVMKDNHPDMVISGINDGANMGDDVLYSGTVAAATEGRFLGYPSIAVSMGSFNPKHFESAGKAVLKLITAIQDKPLKPDTILNVNVPDLPWDEIKGFKATRLGNRHKSEDAIIEKDPRGVDIYWVGPPGPEQDAGEGTDFHAVRSGFVSVTPLQIDLTRYESLNELSGWLETC